jgi:hypothetical protein
LKAILRGNRYRQSFKEIEKVDVADNGQIETSQNLFTVLLRSIRCALLPRMPADESGSHSLPIVTWSIPLSIFDWRGRRYVEDELEA